MADNQGPLLDAIITALLVLALLSFFLRCYVRIRINKSFGIDDYVATAAMACFIAYCVGLYKTVEFGSGQHLIDLTLPVIIEGIKWFWIGEILYICAAMAMRASICVLLLRICVSRWHNITLWALLVINMMFSITSLGLIVFQCKPTEFFWTQYLGATGKCIDHVPLINFTYAFSGISVVSDCIIGILPIFLVWKLQMNLRMKLSVAAILSLGAVAFISSAIRIPYLQRMTVALDFLYATNATSIWSVLEVGTGLIAGNISTLRPLFRAFLERTHVFWSGKSNSSPSESSPSTVRTTSRVRKPNRSHYVRDHGDEGLELGDRQIGATVTEVQGHCPFSPGSLGHKNLDHDSSINEKRRGSWTEPISRMLSKRKTESEQPLRVDNGSALPGEDVVCPWEVKKTIEVDVTSMRKSQSSEGGWL